MNDLLKGIRLSGPLTAIAALAANAVAVYTRSVGFMGTRSQIVRKIMIYNNAAGNTFVHFGTGIPGVDVLPPVMSVNNIDMELDELNIPAVEFFANITSWCDAIVGGGVIDVQIEVEERGG